MENFILFAILTGCFISSATGPIGCFVLWRKMAYYGDSISHAALLGVAFGLLLNINYIFASIIISVIYAIILMNFKNKYNYDTLLAILSHSGIALSILVLSFMKDVRIDLISLLFGDILLIDRSELIWVITLSIFILIWLKWRWKKLLIITINSELAQSRGINYKYLELEFVLIISALITFSIKLVGILLITALLIIPAATAKIFSRSPQAMAVLSVIFGCLSVVGGVGMSYFYNTPSGAAIVVTSLLLFVLSNIFRPKIS